MEKLSAKKFKTFAFGNAGINQFNSETEGIGVGLSTSDSLSDALGGYITMSSGNFGRKKGTEVTFYIKTTNAANLGSF